MGVKDALEGVGDFFSEEKETPKTKVMRKKAEQREKIEEKRSERYVGYWRRNIASAFDGLLVYLSLMLIILIIMGITGMFNQEESSGVAIASVFIFVVGFLLYAPLMQNSSKQATLGQRIFDIIITDTNEKRISFGKAFLRNFLWLFFNISGLLWIVSLIMILTSEKKQELTDKICGCVLLRKSLIQAEKRV